MIAGILFLVGVALGVFIGARYSRITNVRSAIGTLRIDTSDPDDEPYLFLELSVHPNILEHNKIVSMKVDTTNYISQK